MSVAAHRFNNDLRYGAADHQRNTQLTPEYVLGPVRNDLGGIGLDPCTEPTNPTGADRYFTIDDDGLEHPWIGPNWFPSVFVNPPYPLRPLGEHGCERFCMRCDVYEGAT